MSKRKQVTFDMSPPEPVGMEATFPNGEKARVTIRPFNLLDEEWMQEYLEGDDIINLKNFRPVKTCAVLFHQLDEEGQRVFREHLSLPALYDGNWTEIGEAMAGQFDSTAIEPMFHVLVFAREKSLPEVAKSLAEGKEAADKLAKGKRILWTLTIFAALCLVYLAGSLSPISMG